MSVSQSDFYLGDTAFLKKFKPAIVDVITRIAKSAEATQLPYEALESLYRKFGINYDFEIREPGDLARRYR
jgi:hypothetical protein